MVKETEYETITTSTIKNMLENSNIESKDNSVIETTVIPLDEMQEMLLENLRSITKF